MDVENQGKPIAKTYIVCGVLIEKNGKFLLIQEKQAKAFKKWNLPAGKVDEGETLEHAAIREAKEECGYDVELTRELLVMHPAADRPVLHAYGAKIIGGELAFPEDEILDIKWFSAQEIKDLKDELRTPEYVIGALEAL